MNDIRFRILLIEHEPVRHLIKEAIESLFEDVAVTLETNPDRVEDVVKRNNFDLIVTDAYFLEEDQEHLEPDSEDDYQLGTIIGTIRKIEGRRARIAVRTRLSGSLLRKKAEDLERADYLWDSTADTMDLTVWKIQRIRDEMSRVHPGHLLTQQLLALLNDKSELPWNEQMRMMLYEYSRAYPEGEQFKKVFEPLARIFQQVGSEDVFRKVFGQLPALETLNVAGGPSSWGHLRHILNVFWLGYYILGIGLLDIQSFAKCELPRMQLDNETDAMRAVFEAWLVAALFHDIGLTAARAQTIRKGVSEAVKLCVGPVSLGSEGATEEESAAVKSKLNAGLRGLLGVMGMTLSPWFSDVCQSDAAAHDHGLMSACAILRLFGKLEGEIQHAAARAAALHNLIKVSGNGDEETRSIPSLSWTENPLACLLVLCDHVQVWERETGMENSLDRGGIQSCELTLLDCSKGACRMEVNYVPFRYILPVLDIPREWLGNIIDKSVIPTLRRIESDKEQVIGISIRYVLNGRELINTWPRSVR